MSARALWSFEQLAHGRGGCDSEVGFGLARCRRWREYVCIVFLNATFNFEIDIELVLAAESLALVFDSVL